ncbi:MAG: MFS transporter [Acidimicrobiia bacterium]|nr:MFS transporter [Acidimicrobiia bacterium]
MAGRLIRFMTPVKGFSRGDRRLLTLMYLTGVVQGFAQTQAVNTLPFSRLTFGLSEADMSQVLAIARIGALLAIVFSTMGDRYGRRRPFLLAFVMLFVASGATAFVPSTNVNVYTFLQGASRMGAAAVGTLAVVLLAEQLGPENRAWGISVYAAAVSFGSGIGLFALPVARADSESWRYLFAASFIGLILYPLLTSKLPESKAFKIPERRISPLAVFAGAQAGVFWLLAVFSLLVAAFSVIVVTFALERLVNDLGWTTTQASAVMLLGGTAGGIGFFAGGRMADSLGRKATINLSLLMGLVGGLAFYWIENPVLVVPAVAVSSFGSFAAIPAIGAQRNELFPTGVRANAVQWLNSVGVLGSIAGLTVGTITIDQYGLPTTVAMLGAGMVLAVFVMAAVPETLGSQINAQGPSLRST